MRPRVIRAGPRPEPLVTKVKRGAPLSKELEKYLKTVPYSSPVVISAPPGSGKTYAIVHTVLPWAKERGLRTLLVSHRVSLNQQTKWEIVKVSGVPNLLKELTDEGLRVREEFGDVEVITYQRLYQVMLAEPERLKKIDMLIFDEIHSLLEDALFVPCTWHVLDSLLDYFAGAIRIYLSARPDDVLPLLCDAERLSQLQVLKFPIDYSYVRPFFFQDPAELVNKINADSGPGKWLVFISSITEGQKFKDQLSVPVRLLNGAEREIDVDGWNTVLREERFNEKVCITTAVVDAGVNFKDTDLRNIVIFSQNLTTIIQFLGRKRRAPAEKVNLFVQCPSRQEIDRALHQNQVLIEAVDLYETDYPRFLNQYVLPNREHDLRGWVSVNEKGRLVLNKLVIEKLRIQRVHLEELLQRATRNEGDCRFDEVVAKRLRISLPDRARCWLDPKFSGEAKAELDAFLHSYADKIMDKDSFTAFSKKFANLYVADFGSRIVK